LARGLGRERRLDQFDPVAHAIGKRGVVEVISGVVHLGAVAVADEDERPRAGLEHEGKILGAHDRKGVRFDMGVACDFAGDGGGKVGLGGMIDCRRIAASVFNPRCRSGRRSKTGGDLVDSLLDGVAGCSLERADRAVEPGQLRNDVAGVPASKRVTETTQESSGSTLRDTMVCKAITICAPRTTGSTH